MEVKKPVDLSLKTLPKFTANISNTDRQTELLEDNRRQTNDICDCVSNMPDECSTPIKGDYVYAVPDDIDIDDKQSTYYSVLHFGTDAGIEITAENSAAAVNSNADESGREDKTVISIIHTNDEHRYLRRMPYMISLVNDMAKKEPDHVIISGGDFAYNPPASEQGDYWKPMVSIMNEGSYDALGVGNHDFQNDTSPKFVWEKSEIKRLSDNLKFPLLGANVIDPSTSTNLPNVKPYIFKEVNGIKVGVVGVVTPQVATSAHPEVGRGLKFLNPAETLKKVIPQMKADGADLIVVTSHQGIDDDPQMAASVPGIDIILAAHDHQVTKEPMRVKNPDGRTTLIVEAGSHGKYVGDLQATVDRKTKKITNVSYHLVAVTEGIKPDPEVAAIVEHYKEK